MSAISADNCRSTVPDDRFPLQALEHRTYVVARPNGTDKYRIYAPDIEKDPYAEFTTSTADLGMSGVPHFFQVRRQLAPELHLSVVLIVHVSGNHSFAAAPTKGSFKPYWANYIRGVIAQFDQRAGFDAAVVSNIPIGGGLVERML